MTVSEFVFLALGLLLGVAAGAALVEVLRARPPAPREVRVTVAQDAVPRRRSATLADDAFAAATAEPARGGPADRRLDDGDLPPGSPDRRTPVRPAVVVASGAAAMGPEAAAAATPSTSADLVGVPVTGGDDPMIAAFRASAAASAVAAMRQADADAVRARGDAGEAATDSGSPAVSATTGAAAAGGAATTATAVRASSGGPPPSAGSGAGGSPAGRALSTGDAATDGPCAEQRRVADERCELAGRARSQAAAADDALRAARRAYDESEARAEAAARRSDPRAVRDAKDAAQTAFRAGRNAATTHDEVEAAARAWLDEINRINADARDAAAEAAREHDMVRGLTLQLEHLALEADAARISAETAEVACLAAREAAADCDERQALDELDSQPVAPAAAIGLATEDEALSGALGGGGTPRIFRLLRGERAAMGELVAALGGDDSGERRRWQMALSDLVDAIIADSIAASVLDFPDDHPFWGPFALVQDREIANALASLGYRFDGLGGWVDGRIPSQRDLSLAVGYAGLDPMRIRHWPNEAEMAELYRDVTVAADEHLASRAGDLTLGELVAMLGRRADGLADIWNEWGRLRPLLLAEG